MTQDSSEREDGKGVKRPRTTFGLREAVLAAAAGTAVAILVALANL